MIQKLSAIAVVVGVFAAASYAEDVKTIKDGSAKAAVAATSPTVAPTDQAASASGTLSWETIKTRLMHLKEGLMNSAVEHRYQNRSASAVAAVRGAEQKLDDPNKPYWKGTAQSKKEQRLRQERSELAADVDLLLSGKLADGKKKLTEFEASHPKSSLLKDVRETMSLLEKMPADVSTVPADSKAAASGDPAAADPAH